MKFEKAKELSEKENLTLDEIAPLIGLHDKSNVSKLFKEFGYKPERKIKQK